MSAPNARLALVRPVLDHPAVRSGDHRIRGAAMTWPRTPLEICVCAAAQGQISYTHAFEMTVATQPARMATIAALWGRVGSTTMVNSIDGNSMALARGPGHPRAMRRGRASGVNFAAEAFVWMVLACFVEVLVTATVERLSLGDRYVLAGAPWASLQGHTTLWNIVNGVGLTVGLRVLIGVFRQHRVFRKWWWRGIVVMLLIYACELAGGLLFNKLLGFQLWDYSQYVWHGVPLHLLGQITLVYAPFWFLAGIFVTAVYRAVHAVAPYVGIQLERFVVDVEHRL